MSNNIVIRNLDPQEITIQEGGTISGITNVYVNGTDVTIGTKAYVIVPTKLSELTNDEGFITAAEETDPTVPSYVKNITQADINSWNSKQDQLVNTQNIKSINGNSILGSGNLNITNEYEAGTGIDITGNVISNTITSYDDLTDTPVIPTSVSQLSNDSGYVTKYVDDLTYYLSTSELEKILPKVSDSGSDLYLEDSAAFRMDIKLKPHEMEQVTTTGKNMLNPIGADKDENGINFVNNGDGTFTADGTATANVTFPLTDPSISPILLEANESYTQTLYVLSGTWGGSVVPAFKNGGGTITYNYFNNNALSPYQTKTPTEDMTCHTYYYFVPSGTTVTNCTFRVQLAHESTSTPYEEYTGGMPSPNPLYPQDIHVTTGENSITVCGKNLFSEWISGTVNTTTGEITSVARNMTDYIPVNPSTSYALWREDIGFATYFMEYDENKGFVREQHISSANTSGIFTTSATTKFVILFQYTSYSPTNKAQLEVGSTVTTYAPYQSQEYPIDIYDDFLRLDTCSDRLYRNIPTDPDYNSHVETGRWCIRQNVYPVYLSDIGEFTDVIDHGDRYSFYNYHTVDVPRDDILINPYGKSMYFNNVADGNTNLVESVGLNTLRIDLDKKIGISTVEDLEQWISDNQVVVYFGLIPGYSYGTSSVNETLNTELNDLTENNTAYEGGTNITQENDDLPFDIEASVFKRIS